MDIKFLGATQTVTGSKHLVKGINHNILVDCGLYQGPNANKYNQKIESLLSLKSRDKIDAVLLTHAHLDHCGYLPKFYKEGFRGPIFCTPASYDIAKVVMSDNARIQGYEVKRFNKNIKKEKDKKIPMYTQTEVNQVLSNFITKDFNKEFNWQEFTIEFKKVGHILGASGPVIRCGKKKIQFSGDLGRNDDLVINPPSAPEKVDTLVLESTYGGRSHMSENLTEFFKKIISQAKRKSAAIIIPAFSVGRSQTLMKILYEFFQNNHELKLPVFVDSPMTQEVTKLYYKYKHEHKLTDEKLKKIEKQFHFIQHKSEKDKLDNITDAHIILTAGGMLTGGNILHHLAVKGSNPDNAIVIVGHQSEDSLGHQLLSNNRVHNLEGKNINIKAKIFNIESLSSHADHQALIAWAIQSEAKKIFLTHGEENSKIQLAQELKYRMKCEVIIPKLEEIFSI